MTDLERALLHIKTRADAWALKEVEKALSQVSEIEENIIKYMKKYPNHVGNTDFWEGFYACRNVVLQLDDEEYVPKEQEPCDDAISRQAVLDGIEELKKSPWATDKRGNGFEYLITEALDVVKDLCIKQAPSVTQKPMECDDAISRDAVKAILSYARLGESKLAYEVDKLPSVTQKSESVTEFADRCRECGAKYGKMLKQKSGKWILLDECANSGYYCSNCQKKLVKEGWSQTVKKIKYCPNCGARMESEDKEW